MKKAETSSESPEIKNPWRWRSSAEIKLNEIKLKLEKLLKDLLGAVDDNKREVANPKLMEENLLFQVKWLKDHVARIDLALQELHELIRAEETPSNPLVPIRDYPE